MEKTGDPLTGRARISRYAAEKVVSIKRPDGDYHTCFIPPSMNAEPIVPG
jgi:hypothetical protein